MWLNDEPAHVERYMKTPRGISQLGVVMEARNNAAFVNMLDVSVARPRTGVFFSGLFFAPPPKGRPDRPATCQCETHGPGTTRHVALALYGSR